MGMTDKQFNGFLRLLLDALEEIRDEENEKKREEKLACPKISEHFLD